MVDCEIFVWNRVNSSTTLLIKSKDEEAIMDRIESTIVDMIDHSSCFVDLSSDLAALAVAYLQLSTDKSAAFDVICSNLLVFEWSSQHILTGLYLLLQLCREHFELDWGDYEVIWCHILLQLLTVANFIFTSIAGQSHSFPSSSCSKFYKT